MLRIAVPNALIGLAVLACADLARASEVFPATIESRLHLSYRPACTICHATDEGEKGTVVKPFGISMQRLGVIGNSETSRLIAALSAAESRQLDSDFDGTPDITELRNGTDPNDGLDLPIPQTGCALVTPGCVRRDSMLLVISAVGLAFWVRRRRSTGTQQQLRITVPRC